MLEIEAAEDPGRRRRRVRRAPARRYPDCVAPQPVELHVVSDSTGETATRLVHALEAQFPDQAIRGDPPPDGRERRRPRARRSAREGPARGRHLHARRARAARADADPLPAGAPALLRPARPADRGRREGLGHGRDDAARRSARARRDVLPAHGGDRVRRQVRRRHGRRPARGGHRPRRRLPNLEDAALDLPRLPRLPGGERPARQGDRPAGRALRHRCRRRSSA